MDNDELKRRAIFQEIASQMAGDNLDRLMSEQAVIARYQKIRYDAFIKAGFTPQEAIQLCR